jgi:phosphatidylglycerol lysyltransferase
MPSLHGNLKISHVIYARVLSFEIIPAEAVPPLLPELRRVSDQWLEGKNTREKRFSLGFFSESYLSNGPVAVVRATSGPSRVVALANLWQGAELEEISIDLMRHAADAPAGVMDYLFLKLMIWGRDAGYEWFNIGMAPFSGLESRSIAPLWNKLGAMLFRHGEHFYNFQGLRQYKEKFDPVWRPRYLAYPGGLVLPVILTNVATLISGGLKGVVAK